MAAAVMTYQGIDVIEREPEVRSRHPRWGYDEETRPILKGASLILLADEVELVVCNECGYNGITGANPYVKPEGEQKEVIFQADSVLSHINGKHRANRRRTSLYSDDDVRAAIKIFLKWKGSHLRNWTQMACNELDRLGFKPYRGERWTPGALGSLVRAQMKKQKFKNIKAAPVKATDQGALASMVSESAAREGGNGVAANARIVEQRKPRGGRQPIDYDKIIEEQEAARAARLEEEAEVPTSKTGNPKLNFVGSTEPTPTKTLVVDQMSIPVASPALAVVTPEPAKSDYQHVAELPDGTPMFRYKDGPDLMIGKKVKSVEI